MRDKRIKVEKIHYGRKEVRRKIKAVKKAERVFDKKTKIWMLSSSIETGGLVTKAKTKPSHRGECPPSRALHPSWGIKYKRLDEKKTYFW